MGNFLSRKGDDRVYLNDFKRSHKRFSQEPLGLPFLIRKDDRGYSASVLNRKFKPKDDRKELFHSLKYEDDEEVFHAFHCCNSHEILVRHEPSNIVISWGDLQCLRPGAWLNDEVINLYLELLKERERREPEKFLKCHFFNTFFFEKLANGKNGYDFEAVRRWTTKKKLGYTLIECDKVFVPIHKKKHWCLAVINIKDETFQYLDSLGGKDIHVLEVLARYLMEETRDKGDTEIDSTSWKKELVDDLPLQKNGRVGLWDVHDQVHRLL
ncbi:ubiquitin-like-specific protease 1A isoform X2 [Dendrobium catenatum]|uniref:ubiquitin-like-specific protease 1A isoform X2 n=1 Tax=Dendrobium catenatum TaxID=906689 RepID=UPI0009F7400D|nr:ubiquitin-like-specific protease 1A isoform X2 [Dendrobium catenatum]